MRAFIAVPLPVEIKAILTNLQGEFRHLSVEAAWIREAGFHLTLKFLGDIEPAQVSSIGLCLIEAVKDHHPFAIALRGIGIFPDDFHPRVLWVGVRDETGHLVQLQRTVEASLVKCGFSPEDRPFRPHLTLARLKRIGRRAEFLSCVDRHRDTMIGTLPIERLELLESQLHPSGARYLALKVVPLPMPIAEFTA